MACSIPRTEQHVDRLENHPIRKLYDAGVTVTVNTDDVLVFGKGVSEEFLDLYQANVFTPHDLDEIRRAGLRDTVIEPGRACMPPLG